MIYILGGLAAVFLILRQLAPTRHIVHAALPKIMPKWKPTKNKWLLAGFLRDADGRHVNVLGKFLGTADGDSMEAYGIRSGSSFVADRLTDVGRRALQNGDIVVLIEREDVNKNYCLRRVDKVIDGGKVAFLPDSKGVEHSPRPLADIEARVTFVV